MRDILFIDTTHTVKIGSDVNRLMLEVLPTLRPGVLVHVHDIFLPYEYPRGFFESQCCWQEQYLLQALLAENPNFEVLLPAAAIARERPELISALMPWPRPVRSGRVLDPARGTPCGLTSRPYEFSDARAGALTSGTAPLRAQHILKPAPCPPGSPNRRERRQ